LLCICAAVFILGIGGYAFIIEPHWLELTNVQLHSAKISHPFRVAIVADLQTDEIGSHERKALDLALESEPDLILMPGDYLQENSRDRHRLGSEFNDLLKEFEFGAPLGAFATQGDTEHNDWPNLFAASGVTPLTNTTTISAGDVNVTGLDLADSLDTSIHVKGYDRYHIVFGHSPNFAMGNVDADLLIAGHTHGGQVRIPVLGPILTLTSVPRAWASGVTKLGEKRTLIVSRGIGLERGRAPRLRFFCRPEIVIADILPEPE
jgi:hypothetical protein